MIWRRLSARRTTAAVLIAVVALLHPAIASGAGGTMVTDWTNRPHGPTYGTVVAPMDTTVRTRIAPRTERLLQMLLSERRDTALGGVKIFASGDKFLSGKIAMAMAYRVASLDEGPARQQALHDFTAIAALTIDDPNETWGIYYYLSALNTLHERGLLQLALPPSMLATLRKKLDWRTFVRPDDLSLIDLPNNYYGVAFSVARLRYLLGWENADAGAALLTRTLDHYRRYSGTFGFADETDGEGRFDRYSVLLIGEIAQRMIETGITPSAEVRGWLRRSVDLLLPRFNLSGEGFEYGRSIGAYGETAFLEVLTAAAKLKILSSIEERMAYAFSCRISARYVDFWADPVSDSVDLWSRGRRTDSYRGIHRIFGENLSLARQHFYTNAIWNELGYRGRIADRGYARWLATLPRYNRTWFARGRFDRALVTIRDRGHVIGLPIVNGADPQHANNPYFPIPFSPGMLQGAADAGYPQLLPRITLIDGSVLMPLAYFQNVSIKHAGNRTDVSWLQPMADRLGGKSPLGDPRLSIETRYRFLPGKIERRDRLVPAPGVTIKKIDMEFASYSSAPKSVSAGVITYHHGEVRKLVTTGYKKCIVGAPDRAVYAAPTGPFTSLVRCTTKGVSSMRVPLLGWQLFYDRRANYDP